MKVTLKKVNERIAPLGYELVKGNGYFYFWPLQVTTPTLKSESVMVYRLSELTVDEWEKELQMKIADLEACDADTVLESKKFKLIL